MKLLIPVVSFMGTSRKINFTVLIILWCLSPALAKAQMFSAGTSQSPDYEHAPQFNAFAGIEPIHFKYRGKSSIEGNNISPGATDIYAFKGSIIRFGIALPVVKLNIGIGGSATGLDNRSYFDIGLRLGYGLNLYHSRSFAFYLPLQLHTAYTSVNNDDFTASLAPLFQVGTVGGTVGAGAQIRPARNFRITAGLLPTFGYAFSYRDQNRSGTIVDAKGQLHLFFDHLFGKAGLSLGYAYIFRQFNINGELLDYRSLGNSILIGVTF